MVRHGQAALEFLTTYGWAFMVILVMIGALAYFGVINPNTFLPERCQLQGEFNCKDFQVLSTGTAKFYFMNNLGESIKSVKFSAKVANSDTSVDCTLSESDLASGESSEATCNGLETAFLSTGQKAKILLNGTYQLTNGKYPRPIQGEIFATVQ